MRGSHRTCATFKTNRRQTVSVRSTQVVFVSCTQLVAKYRFLGAPVWPPSIRFVYGLSPRQAAVEPLPPPHLKRPVNTQRNLHLRGPETPLQGGCLCVNACPGFGFVGCRRRADEPVVIVALRHPGHAGVLSSDLEWSRRARRVGCRILAQARASASTPPQVPRFHEERFEGQGGRRIHPAKPTKILGLLSPARLTPSCLDQ